MSTIVCRLCNSSNTKLTSSLSSEIIQSFLELIPQVQINANLQLSASVCQLCFGKAKVSFDFITKIQETQNEINKKYKNTPPSTSKSTTSAEVLERIRQTAGISVRRVQVEEYALIEEIEMFPDEVEEEVYEDDEEIYTAESDELDLDEEQDEDYEEPKKSSKRKKPMKKHDDEECQDKEIIITAPISYTCSKCTAKYADLESLTDHMKARDCFTPKVYVCECGKQFDKRKSFYSHRANHKPKEKVICEVCAKAFSHNYDLESHMETAHRRNVRRGDCIFKCTHCHQNFTSHLDLLDHVREHQREKKEAPRLCEICAKVCANLRAYQAHLVIHKDKKPHNCQVS